jgi:hypothetical protein
VGTAGAQRPFRRAGPHGLGRFKPRPDWRSSRQQHHRQCVQMEPAPSGMQPAGSGVVQCPRDAVASWKPVAGRASRAEPALRLLACHRCPRAALCITGVVALACGDETCRQVSGRGANRSCLRGATHSWERGAARGQRAGAVQLCIHGREARRRRRRSGRRGLGATLLSCHRPACALPSGRRAHSPSRGWSKTCCPAR